MRRLWQGIRAALRRVLAIARKEMRQLVRDRTTMAMIVGIPAIQLVLFGYAINLDVRGVSTAVVDRARSSASRKLLGEIEATQTFRIRARADSEAELVRMLERSAIGAGKEVAAGACPRLPFTPASGASAAGGLSSTRPPSGQAFAAPMAKETRWRRRSRA